MKGLMIDDAGFVEVGELPDYLKTEVEEAIKNCPADCIYWEET